ncbi:MAG: hypothetical protein KatS3mg087_0506 [Patescibacteria group bacterium]|nr:MAG: hypothetical protein KatS3mg087_0506 [Patescibacteria group bacterium]
MLNNPFLGHALKTAVTAVTNTGKPVNYFNLFDSDARTLAKNPELFNQWDNQMREAFNRAIEDGDTETAEHYSRMYRLMWNRVQAYRLGETPGFLSPDDANFINMFGDRYVASGGLRVPNKPKTNPNSGRILGLSEKDLNTILPILLLLLLRNK